ncbi:MAG: flagellar biosynthesis anti-sigma factor FlgM [Chloroflexota bacterium]|nr:flagellar biosynthesis anti-sigma factor FlgM [Chloroflexota bacterium]
MSVDRLSTESASRGYVQQAHLARPHMAAAREADKSDSGTANRVDSVTLSSNARALAVARQAVKSSDGDLRPEKVADIKQRVSDGTYSVDARVLARKLLGSIQP